MLQGLHQPGGLFGTQVYAIGSSRESILAHFTDAYPGCDIHVTPTGCMPFIEVANLDAK